MFSSARVRARTAAAAARIRSVSTSLREAIKDHAIGLCSWLRFALGGAVPAPDTSSFPRPPPSRAPRLSSLSSYPQTLPRLLGGRADLSGRPGDKPRAGCHPPPWSAGHQGPNYQSEYTAKPGCCFYLGESRSSAPFKAILDQLDHTVATLGSRWRPSARRRPLHGSAEWRWPALSKAGPCVRSNRRGAERPTPMPAASPKRRAVRAKMGWAPGGAAEGLAARSRSIYCPPRRPLGVFSAR